MGKQAGSHMFDHEYRIVFVGGAKAPITKEVSGRPFLLEVDFCRSLPTEVGPEQLWVFVSIQY